MSTGSHEGQPEQEPYTPYADNLVRVSGEESEDAAKVVVYQVDDTPLANLAVQDALNRKNDPEQCVLLVPQPAGENVQLGFQGRFYPPLGMEVRGWDDAMLRADAAVALQKWEEAERILQAEEALGAVRAQTLQDAHDAEATFRATFAQRAEVLARAAAQAFDETGGKQVIVVASPQLFAGGVPQNMPQDYIAKELEVSPSLRDIRHIASPTGQPVGRLRIVHAEQIEDIKRILTEVQRQGARLSLEVTSGEQGKRNHMVDPDNRALLHIPYGYLGLDFRGANEADVNTFAKALDELERQRRKPL